VALDKKQVFCVSAFFLYTLSLCLIIGAGVYVISIFIEFIIVRKGIGVYGVLFYYVASFLSVIIWGISYWLIPNKKMAIFYWVIFSVLTIFIALQPTWWAAPAISN